MGRATGYILLGAAGILGFALVYAALIEQGLILQPAGSLQKGRVITTSSGHVNLGVVYSESKMVDVTITQRTKSGETLDLIILKGINPYNYEQLITDALKESIVSGRPGYKFLYNMKGAIDDVTLASEGTLTVRTYIQYRSEYQAHYNYNIATRKYTFSTDEPVLRFALKKTSRLINNSQKRFRNNMFLDGKSDDLKSEG
ncbi:hypothetical protein [Pantoea sp. BAV 3049]|uniref:hypothetical protein n=1 Tax=Pantoea sp. BAV 3049 TaxID=2654188 RepID=UPI00131B3992|nr:hypothetical protein [Pantoea sp. BAV 3049]